MEAASLSPYVKIPSEHLLEDRRVSHRLMKFKGSADSFSKRIVIQTCETQGFDSVVQAMEEGAVLSLVLMRRKKTQH